MSGSNTGRNTGSANPAELAELVVIFPSNVWEYDVLNYFPCADLQTGAGEPAPEGTE